MGDPTNAEVIESNSLEPKSEVFAAKAQIETRIKSNKLHSSRTTLLFLRDPTITFYFLDFTLFDVIEQHCLDEQ